MRGPYWPHPGHADPLAEFRALRALDTMAWLGGPGVPGADMEDIDLHRQRFGLSEVWLGALGALAAGNALEENERLLLESRRHAWVVPFVTVRPEMPRSLAQWAGLGAQGVRLAPGVAPEVSDDAWRRLATEAASRGLMVQVVARVEDARVALSGIAWTDPSPARLVGLCAASPAAQLSGLNAVEIRAVAEGLGDPSRSVFDLWFVGGPTGAVAALVREGARLCFGSGFPLQSPSAAALPLVTARITSDERAAVARRQSMSHDAESS